MTIQHSTKYQMLFIDSFQKVEFCFNKCLKIPLNKCL